MRPMRSDERRLIFEWEEDIRKAWEHALPPLSVVNIWGNGDNPCMSMSLVFAPTHSTVHNLTHWFLIDLETERVTYHSTQQEMFAAVIPQKGNMITFWNTCSAGWQMIHAPAYEFKMPMRTKEVQFPQLRNIAK